MELNTQQQESGPSPRWTSGTTDQKTAGEHVKTRVPTQPRSGDPRRRHHLRHLFGRRRVSRDLDELLGIVKPTIDVTDVDYYRMTGLDLGYVERERAGAADGRWSA